MRYKRALTNDQLKYLIDNCTLPNQELADTLGTSKEIIASYKSRARKAGVKIPYQTHKGTTIEEDIKKMAEPVIHTPSMDNV